MSERKWTAEQDAAITSRGGSLLVSAAAGSGKTAVLIERIVRKITGKEHPCDVDKLAVVTFSKAAAGEMKERLHARLGELSVQNPGDLHIKRQQFLLPSAKITTIHSFCSDLLRDNFHKLELSPDFKVMADNDGPIYKQEALEQTFGEMYESDEEGLFSSLSDYFGSDKKPDEALQKIILDIHTAIVSIPFGERWLAEKLDYLCADGCAGQVYKDTLSEFAAAALWYGASLMEQALILADEDERYKDAHKEVLTREKEAFEETALALEQGDFDKGFEMIHGIKKMNIPKVTGDDVRKARITALREHAIVDAAGKCKKLFCADSEQTQEDNQTLYPLVKKLFETVLAFEKNFSAIKRERNVVDFNDMEQLTVSLLVQEEGDGFVLTEDARALSLCFEEILVDEYQDANAAQEMIFTALSRNEENLFTVGDVKQSIYVFRQAMPEIFLARRSRYPLFDPENPTYPATILLSRNFRSREGVTGAVNFIFSQLMSRQAGGVDYNDEEALVAAAEYPPTPETAFSLLMPEQGKWSGTEAEALCMAREIKDMVGSFQVFDKGLDAMRPARYSDICILLRSKKNKINTYVKILEQEGVPVWTPAEGSFFQSREMAAVLSFLKVIDNPLLDTSLAAALMSPLFAFTPDDMAEIRRHERKEALYISLTECAKAGHAKSADFLALLDKLRSLSAILSANELIGKVYSATGCVSLMQALPGGGARLANLRRLREYARSYEEGGYRGLSEFIQYMNRLEQRGESRTSDASAAHSEAVQIETIHHSKGLEFPIVFLGDLQTNQNQKGNQAVIRVHPRLGVGLACRDASLKRRYSCLNQEAVKLAIKQDSQSEELRILYVALTRAKEKLCVVIPANKLEKKLTAVTASFPPNIKTNPMAVRMTGAMEDFFLMCALRHPSGRALREMIELDETDVLSDPYPWDIRMAVMEEREETEASPEDIPAAKPSPELVESFEKIFSYEYPYAQINRVVAKASASDLTKMSVRIGGAKPPRPAFMGTEKLTPAQKGTLLHRFLELMPLGIDGIPPQEKLNKLIKEGHFTEEEAKAVPLDRVERFLQSSLWQRLCKSPRVLREHRFTVYADASLVDPALPPNCAGEQVVVQGIIDCLFEEPEGLVLMDYKTDWVQEPETLVERYQKQLDIYRYAAEKSLNKPVKSAYLYSFSLNTEVCLETKKNGSRGDSRIARQNHI